MENKFDKIAKFVESLERTSLSEDQQVMILAGGIYDDTTTGYNSGKECINTITCFQENDNKCTNQNGCTGTNYGQCTNIQPCEAGNQGSCTNTGTTTPP